MSFDPTVASILPFWGRVTAMESSVEEDTRSSGLIVPYGNDVERAVVLHVGPTAPMGPSTEGLGTGSVIYYRKGRCVKIREIIVVEFENIVAYEEGLTDDND